MAALRVFRQRHGTVAWMAFAVLALAEVHATETTDLEALLRLGFQLQSAEPSSATTVPGTSGGPAAVRFRLDARAPRVANGHRVEFKGRTAPIDRGVAQWYVFSYLQSDDWLRWRKPVVVGQVHTAQLGSITAPPPLGILVRDGQLWIVLHRSDRAALNIDKQDNRLLSQLSISAGAVVPGQWTCLLVRAVWNSAPGTGELAVWRDSERILLSRNTANAYPTPLGMYPKFGLYAYDGVDGDNMVLDADVLKVLDGKLAVDDVRAQARCRDK